MGMNRKQTERILGILHHLMDGLDELKDMQIDESAEEKACSDECHACGAKHTCEGSCCRKEHVARSESPEAHEMPAPARLKVSRGTAAIEALKVINGERQDTYGNPEDCFASIAGLWSMYFDEQFYDTDVAIMMALLKIARMKNNGVDHRDNFVDAIGYLALAADMAAKPDDGASSSDDDDAVD